MITKALIVEDDLGFVHQVVDVLDALGHKHDVAGCFHDAKRLINENQYDYCLVDLEIPVKPGCPPRIQNGEHAIEAISNRHGALGPPILVVTGHGRDTPELAARTMQLGAINYITKPLSKSGDTLDRAIASALELQKKRRRIAQQISQRDPLSKEIPFCGGEMVFGEGCVTLCGVKIASTRRYGYSVALLEALSEKGPTDEYVRLSGEGLARQLDALADLNTVTSCIYRLRHTVTERLAEEDPKIKCGPDDVIVRTKSGGYYLRKWITIRDGLTRPTIAPQPLVETRHVPRLSLRQHWILEQLAKGARLERRDVQVKFGLSEKTAKRDLSQLCGQGAIVFERRASPGYYRLKRE